jgi:hypothetical protein
LSSINVNELSRRSVQISETEIRFLFLLAFPIQNDGRKGIRNVLLLRDDYTVAVTNYEFGEKKCATPHLT